MLASSCARRSRTTCSTSSPTPSSSRCSISVSPTSRKASTASVLANRVTRGSFMKELRDKVAFITGGASGLGLAMAKAFGREGMKVMIADIEQQALTRAVDELRASQVRAEGVICDVGSRAAVREAALKTIATYGKVHVVCNNAG